MEDGAPALSAVGAESEIDSEGIGVDRVSDKGEACPGLTQVIRRLRKTMKRY